MQSDLKTTLHIAAATQGFYEVFFFSVVPRFTYIKIYHVCIYMAPIPEWVDMPFYYIFFMRFFSRFFRFSQTFTMIHLICRNKSTLWMGMNQRASYRKSSMNEEKKNINSEKWTVKIVGEKKTHQFLLLCLPANLRAKLKEKAKPFKNLLIYFWKDVYFYFWFVVAIYTPHGSLQATCPFRQFFFLMLLRCDSI